MSERINIPQLQDRIDALRRDHNTLLSQMHTQLLEVRQDAEDLRSELEIMQRTSVTTTWAGSTDDSLALLQYRLTRLEEIQSFRSAAQEQELLDDSPFAQTDSEISYEQICAAFAERRFVRMVMPSESFVSFILPGSWLNTLGCSAPSGTRFVAMSMDSRGQCDITLAHPAFPPVTVGMEIPVRNFFSPLTLPVDSEIQSTPRIIHWRPSYEG